MAVTHLFSATPAALSATLFPLDHPPFSTVFLLEFSPSLFPPTTSQDPQFTHLLNALHLHLSVIEPDKSSFKSSAVDVTNDVIVAGLILVFSRSIRRFWQNPDFTLRIFLCENVKEGSGEDAVSAVAVQAVNMGYGRVELVVQD